MSAGLARLLRPCIAIVTAVVTVVVAGNCTDINAANDHVASLEFSRLPYPAVVAGDTLRDSLGVVAPLRAIAFNSAGSEVNEAEIQYIALDTGLTITEHDLVIAQRRSGSVPIVASATTIQTRQLALLVARRPDSAAFHGPARDTVDYVIPDVASTNATAALAIKVTSTDTAGGIATTQGWLVSYRTVFHGAALAPGDTSRLFLVADGAARTAVDTTDGSGIASRRLRVNPAGLPPGVDSAVVTASVRYRGADIRGSPLHFVILFRNRAP